MSKFNTLAARFARDERGASLVEYSVLIGLLTAATVTLIATTGGTIVAKWTALNGVFVP
jgi:pilus assembly protein Flp/PilA